MCSGSRAWIAFLPEDLAKVPEIAIQRVDLAEVLDALNFDLDFRLPLGRFLCGLGVVPS